MILHTRSRSHVACAMYRCTTNKLIITPSLRSYALPITRITWQRSDAPLLISHIKLTQTTPDRFDSWFAVIFSSKKAAKLCNGTNRSVNGAWLGHTCKVWQHGTQGTLFVAVERRGCQNCGMLPCQVGQPQQPPCDHTVRSNGTCSLIGA